MSPGRDIPVPSDSAELVRLLLGVAAGNGADARRLAREAHVPDWAMAPGHAMVPTRLSLRLFELTERALDRPDLGLLLPRLHTVGDLDLYDYLFCTAATFGDAMRVSGDFIHLISTNDRISVEESTSAETTFGFHPTEADGRGGELLAQLAVAMFAARAQAGTGKPVTPARVAFPFAAPRRYRRFAETLGISHVEFGSPVTSFTFTARDLRLPMARADPRLAHFLRDYASMLPAPAPGSWIGQFRHRLEAMLGDGRPSLDRVASELAVSARTLQRRLGEHGTTWRAELDLARNRLSGQADTVDPRRLADRLGYADPRSLRRARQRWKDRLVGPAPDAAAEAPVTSEWTHQ
jgi:AraC-like DNA-binding protein